jgi:enterochelin esterase-like enzyme
VTTLTGPQLSPQQRLAAGRPPSVPGPAHIPTGPSARLAQLQAQLAGAARDAAADAVERFWAEAAASGTPLMERGDDPSTALATFLWRGEAGAVVLFANKRFDRERPERTALARLDGTDIWHLTLRLPADWQGSYQFLVTPEPSAVGDLRRLQASGSAARDPLNPVAMRQGPEMKSVLDLAGSWTLEPGVAPDATEHRLAGPDGDVAVWTVDPAPGGSPADQIEVVLLDGRMWVEQLNLPGRLHAATARGQLPRVRLVLVDDASEGARASAMSCSSPFARFLAQDAVRLAAARWGAVPADRRVVAGSSLSGLQAVFTALAHPEAFGAALSQSGSFWWPSSEAAAGVEPEWLTRQVPAGSQRFCLQDGLDEWVNTGATQRMTQALRDAGHRVTSPTIPGGHDRVWWAARFVEGLAALLDS